ncbi:BtpA/SgcQ family protein [Carboxydochorda subterranea]|uniref:BtpA/SgcQ family protein n=1 Tax=Carboxydichorda subterranea TaxID=3109565 RepID=A0ABZ1BWY5_9FIRM|nr:BtpA/SgcQ family protein [Limnochorda sp. L945t]WRP17292.1 BtpA/SgcQ family protein [Limnochorda sp. L945t]
MSTVFRELLGVEKPIIAMCHFPPMPGSPLYDARAGLEGIKEWVARDIRHLQDGGVDAIMFCNEGDRPYTLKASPATLATMASVIGQLRSEIRVPFGVDVLWDPVAAIALASATGARFVREVFTGVYSSDMGLWNTNAGESLRFRRNIGADHVKLIFNINAEFAGFLGQRPLPLIAQSVVFSSLADVVAVSGTMTGQAPQLPDLELVKRAVPDTPVVANTGVRAENVREILQVADGVIVGTALKQDGNTWKPVDPDRVKRFVGAARG